ncbi:MAG: YeeE/YedE thiosulfate transporter family protein [Pseudomonadota bacterium]
METEFTPVISLLGGAFIGLAAVLLMAVQGRIFGATGLLGGLLLPVSRTDVAWRVWVILGMLSGPVLYTLILGAQPVVQVPGETWHLVIGGVLVGIGAHFGSGCPSGHGVCGLARFSARSAVAVITFMTVAAVTVFVLRHLVGG